MADHSPFGVILQAFFTEHLTANRRLSPCTIDSYRHTFRLLLAFLRQTAGIQPSAVRITDLDAPAVLSFLDHLEKERTNSIRSRNLRLAAIRSFFRYATLRDIESIPVASRVLAIPVKRTEHRLVGHLTKMEIDAILTAPDQSRWDGRRDHALLLTLYNSGARVSEITSLTRSSVDLGAAPSIHLRGKGRKDRQVPLWKKTARVLRKWLREIMDVPGDTAFPSTRGVALSTDGVAYLLQKAVSAASSKCPSLADKHVTPHVIRHSTAMHLLQSGVDISIIALWLGHESIETTHMYLEADLTTKQKALDKLAPTGGTTRRFKADDALLTFLSSL